MSKWVPDQPAPSTKDTTVSNAKQEVTPTQVTTATPVQRWMEDLRYEADHTYTDDNVGEQQALKALEADSLEDAVAVLEGAGLPSGKDMLGKPHVVTGFQVRHSDPTVATGAGAFPFYFTVQAADPKTGEEILYNTGATNILVVLWKARQANRLPIKVIITGKGTKNGTLLSLKLLD